MQDFRQLDVWCQAMELCDAVYEATRTYDPDERFGLVAQSRRSAVSVASNIAEGAGRPSQPDFARFLGYAVGSLSELETQIEIARRVGYLEATAADRLIGEIARLGRRIVSLHRRVGRATA